MSDTADTKCTEGKNGNTKRTRHFCFTLNNYVEDDINMIKSLFDKYTFQEEAGSTPHLQGVGSFTNPRTFDYIKKSLPRAHIETCRNLKASIEYCLKPDTRNGRQWSTHKALVKDPLQGKTLYKWQKEILEILKKEPDERTIHWYWSKDGNIGKTTFIKHCLLTMKNATYVAGKAGDMIFALSTVLEENPHINTVFMNIPRCIEHISYNGLEQIKDGLIFNSKYESGYKMFNSPHIIVMANAKPRSEEMSEDRWHIVEIGKEDSLHEAGTPPSSPSAPLPP